MTATFRQLLDLFDALPRHDQQAAVAELIQRLPEEAELPTSDLDALANELFSALDAEEAASATAR